MLHRKLDRVSPRAAAGLGLPAGPAALDREGPVAEIEGDLVTLRYDDEDGDERHSWEESVRLASIGAVSTRLASLSRSADADDLPTTGDCPESERLGLP